MYIGFDVNEANFNPKCVLESSIREPVRGIKPYLNSKTFTQSIWQQEVCMKKEFFYIVLWDQNG